MLAEPCTYEFDDVRIEAGEYLAMKRGKPVNLEPKAFAVLLLLIERAGSLVSKDEILDTVWRDSFVTPNVLTRAVAQIRRELGDKRGGDGYIATVPKRGYRFIANLKLPPDGREELKIAVLPFTHLNPDGNNDYLGIGIADSLITKLTNIRTLNVRPTSAVLPYSSTNDFNAVGKDLRVANIVSGTVQEYGGTFRVSVQLVRVSDGKPLWGSSYTSKMGDIFDVQDEISSSIAESLRIQLSSSDRERIGRRPTQNAEAFNLYMRGRSHLYPLTPEGHDKAIRLFSRAVELDPGFALAHSGLAGAHLFVSQFGDDEACSVAETSAKLAVELDPTLAEGYAVLAAISFWKMFDADRAESFFRRALELDPNSSETNHFYAWFLTASSRFEEACGHLRTAADLDPVSSSILVDQGLPYYYSRQYPEAREAYEYALEFYPSSWYALMRLGEALEAEGNLASSRAAFEESLSLSGGESAVKCLLARSLALSGDRTRADSLLSEVDEDLSGAASPYYKALVLDALGNFEKAWKAIDVSRIRRDKWYAWFNVDPRLEDLRARSSQRQDKADDHSGQGTGSQEE